MTTTHIIILFVCRFMARTESSSKKYGIITYHTNENMGDYNLHEQFVNPIFMLITILLILFSLFMLSTFILLSCSSLRPHCTKCQKFTKRRCSLVWNIYYIILYIIILAHWLLYVSK